MLAVVGVGLTNGSVEMTLASEAFGSEPDILIVAIGIRARQRRRDTLLLLNVEY